mmetsp:Transcript_9469/g.26990  ORF Transcript_9469/g.26990 Transcript_9469/m.26990 type:complete len:329 (+) Transcript_9469:198-1184(+)
MDALQRRQRLRMLHAQYLFTNLVRILVHRQCLLVVALLVQDESDLVLRICHFRTLPAADGFANAQRLSVPSFGLVVIFHLAQQDSDFGVRLGGHLMALAEHLLADGQGDFVLLHRSLKVALVVQDAAQQAVGCRDVGVVLAQQTFQDAQRLAVRSEGTFKVAELAQRFSDVLVGVGNVQVVLAQASFPYYQRLAVLLQRAAVLHEVVVGFPAFANGVAQMAARDGDFGAVRAEHFLLDFEALLEVAQCHVAVPLLGLHQADGLVGGGGVRVQLADGGFLQRQHARVDLQAAVVVLQLLVEQLPEDRQLVGVVEVQYRVHGLVVDFALL